MRKKETVRSTQGTPRVWCAGVAGKPYLSILACLTHVAAVLTSLLREIFDESAYNRFLERNRISSSTAAYAAFREENDRLKAQRPKCC
jgi:hypothetical protein